MTSQPTTAAPTITREVAAKVLEVVDHGLVSGLGKQAPGEMCIEAAVCYALGLPHGDDPGCVAPALRHLKIALNDSGWSSSAARAKGLRRLGVAQLGSVDILDQVEFAKRVALYTVRTTVPAALKAAAGIHPDEKHRAALEKAAAECAGAPDLDAASAASYAARDAASYAASAASDAASAASYAARAARAARDAASAASYAASAVSAVSYAASAVSDAASAASAASYAASYAARDKALSDFAEGIVQILVEMDAPGCQWLDLCPLDAAASVEA